MYEDLYLQIPKQYKKEVLAKFNPKYATYDEVKKEYCIDKRWSFSYTEKKLHLSPIACGFVDVCNNKCPFLKFRGNLCIWDTAGCWNWIAKVMGFRIAHIDAKSIYDKEIIYMNYYKEYPRRGEPFVCYCKKDKEKAIDFLRKLRKKMNKIIEWI